MRNAGKSRARARKSTKIRPGRVGGLDRRAESLFGFLLLSGFLGFVRNSPLWLAITVAVNHLTVGSRLGSGNDGERSVDHHQSRASRTQAKTHGKQNER
jgi:hypothetical protein